MGLAQPLDLTPPSKSTCREDLVVLVVVSGPPASGKSTLAQALANQLRFPLIAKDTIKDALLEVLPAPDVESSRLIGRAALAALLAVARGHPDAVLESVWHRTRAAAELQALPGSLVEVFCRCDRQTLEARYHARAGSRAAGHFDLDRSPDELWGPETSEPVAGGWPVIVVDTTRPVDVPALASQVRAALG